MATTTNLGLTKPTVGADDDTWGTETNAAFDGVDAVFAAAGSGTSVGIKVGSGKTLNALDGTVVLGSPTLGVQQTTQGALILANTAAGAYPTTIKSSNSATKAYTITLPVDDGTSGQVLSTDGDGLTSWATVSAAEYGTWTPGLSFGGGTTGIVFGTQAGTYVKAGRSVTYGIYFNITNNGSSTGAAKVTGCPYTSESGANTQYTYSGNVIGGAGLSVTAGYTPMLATYYSGSAATLDFVERSGLTIVTMTEADFPDTTTIYANATVITTA